MYTNVATLYESTRGKTEEEQAEVLSIQYSDHLYMTLSLSNGLLYKRYT